jgi:hypothetical protein
MKSRTYLALASAVLLSSVAIPALAEVTILVNVDKTKTITVTEEVTKTKDFLIDVTFENLELTGAAEAIALANVDNIDNHVDQSQQGAPEELGNFGWDKDALIEDSINDNAGIVGVNQDVGNMVNQGNVAAISIIGDNTGSAPAFTNSEAFADQENTLNTVRHLEDLDPAFDNTLPLDDQTFDPNLTATINGATGSINNNSGVIGVNQNAGNMNNQHNLLAMAVGFNALVALSESGLGQVNSGNSVDEVETVKSAEITGSISGNSGIVAVNQAVGNMNNQASVVSFAAMTSTAAITIPGG